MKLRGQGVGDGDGDGRLADAAGADDGDEALAGDLRGQGGHRVGTADHARERHRQILPRLDLLDLPVDAAEHGAAMDGRNEAIAASRDIGDEALPGLSVAEGAAQGGDMDLQIALFHEGVGPYAVEQLLLAQDLARPLQKGDQDVAGTAAEVHRLIAFEQQLLRGKQPEGAKGDFARLFGLVPGHPSPLRLVSLTARARRPIQAMRALSWPASCVSSRDRRARSTPGADDLRGKGLHCLRPRNRGIF